MTAAARGPRPGPSPPGRVADRHRVNLKLTPRGSQDDTPPHTLHRSRRSLVQHSWCALLGPPPPPPFARSRRRYARTWKLHVHIGRRTLRKPTCAEDQARPIPYTGVPDRCVSTLPADVSPPDQRYGSGGGCHSLTNFRSRAFCSAVGGFALKMSKARILQAAISAKAAAFGGLLAHPACSTGL